MLIMRSVILDSRFPLILDKLENIITLPYSIFRHRPDFLEIIKFIACSQQQQYQQNMRKAN